jgi:hypothetical protein
VTFQIAYKAMNDHTWIMSVMAISRCLSCFYDNVNREEVDKLMLSLSAEACNRPIL